MKEDLVSVIMPTYNAGKFLADSIQCILRQTYDNLELIITDDASTDGDTIKILKEFAQTDKRVKIELLSETMDRDMPETHVSKELKEDTSHSVIATTDGFLRNWKSKSITCQKRSALSAVQLILYAIPTMRPRVSIFRHAASRIK